jgi:hypothetical protein
MNETQIQAIIADYRKAVADLDLNPTGWGEAAAYRNAKGCIGQTASRTARQSYSSNEGGT